MKKIYSIILLITLVSCGEANVQSKNTGMTLDASMGSIELVVLDGCEYYFYSSNKRMCLTHKGNCNNPVHKQMSKPDCIKPRNAKGEAHGFWELYFDNGKLFYKGNFINGKEDGWFKENHLSGKTDMRGYHINGVRHGLWKEYYRGGNMREKTYYI